jgi:hypothetical protein
VFDTSPPLLRLSVPLPTLTWSPSRAKALALTNHERGGFYDIMASDAARSVRFSGAMKAFAKSPAYDPRFIVEHYDWGSLGPGAHIVDMGGARGHIATAIVRRFPDLRVTVQDLKRVVEGAKLEVPQELRGRVAFMEHDLFGPQPIRDADVYYVRSVLHNWSDENAVNRKSCARSLNMSRHLKKRLTGRVLQFFGLLCPF